MNTLIPKLNFDILETYDLRILRIADTSDWKHLKTETSYIDIITPARKKPVTHYFNKDSINIFNSNNLELTCTDCKDGLQKLPDGIYNIKIYVCEGAEFFYSACYLRTVSTQLRLNQILINLGLCNCTPDTSVMDRYNEIDMLLTSAHANVIDGNINQGSCEYFKALELLDNLENCNVNCE